ncbi:uncharacterized protein LOC111691049 [Lucilia cuprina]|uniref:uncharacterized protein LOC111691049 n=1 Tax=Lucilia cuprina TaxID=7375 RepID=UPI001F06E7EC|nr:uncharacterized protein LOC111691049 [Lucilia cuprina]
MAKFQFALVLLLVVLAVFSCEAQRQRVRSGRLQRNRQLARQEVEEPITPYPLADELKPEIPFEEAAPAPVDESAVVDEEEVFPADEAAEGAANEPIPDEVYGPPEESVLYNTPDEVYGPPEIEANQLPAEVTLARQRQRQARLVQARRKAAYRQARLAKLRAAKPKRSA